MSHITIPAAVSSVAGKTGAVSLAKGDVGLGNVDNTSDVNKPVSTAQTGTFAAASRSGTRAVGQGELEINAADYLASTASDTAAINAAVAAAQALFAATGSYVSVLVPPKANGWAIQRANPANTSGGIVLPRGVWLRGQHTKLLLTDNCHFIYGESARSATAIVTADTVATDITLTVDSTSALSVGQRLFIQLGQAAYDTGEPAYWLNAQVLAVTDATHVQIDRPVGYALSVAATTNTAHRSLQVVTDWLEQVSISGFELVNPMTGNANAESGIRLYLAGSVDIRDVTGTNVGAGLVYGQYVDNLQTDNLRVRSSAAQGGQASKGRCFNLAEVRVADFRNTHATAFDREVAVLESSVENVRFRGLFIENNAAGRSATSTPLFSHLGGARVSYEDVLIRGNGSLLTSNGGTAGNTFEFHNLSARTAADPIISDMATLTGEVRVRDLVYRETRRWTKTFVLTPSMSSVALDLPSGLARRLRVYASTTTGITGLTISNKTTNGQNVVSQLVAGQTVALTGVCGLSPAATTYKINDFEGKRLIVSTDGTVPANSYLTVELDYFTPANGADDLSQGRIDTPISAISPNVQVFQAGSSTWTKPSGCTTVRISLISGGGGGGSGRRTASATVGCAGGGGGAGGYAESVFPASSLATTENVSVGLGGTGGAAVSADSTNGNAGSNGGATVFGNNKLRSSVGSGGGGGTTSAGTAGAAGNGTTTAGAGGAASTAGGAGNAGQTSGAGGGGGAGGGLASTPAVTSGGAGGGSYSNSIMSVGTAGSGDGGTGGSVTSAADANMPYFGPGGGGGASSIAGVGGAGGNAGNYGGGGGGGGASLNGNNSGAGGNGAPGICVVTAW